MAEPSEKGDYVTLQGVTIWWVPGQPNEIHLTADDPDLTHPDTGPGMRVVFSTNIKSANYHPANFNRCAAILRKYGKSAPEENAVEGNRRLDKRAGVWNQPAPAAPVHHPEGPFDVQSFRPNPDPNDMHGEATGSMVEVMDWLNTFSDMSVESLTALPQDDGGPPIYVVVWRKP